MRHFLEHLVATAVAVSIVDMLEVVYVDEYETERFLGTLAAANFVIDGPVHVAAVREPRQFVRSRNDVQLGIGDFKFAGAFLDFLFQHVAVGVQFADLPFDGGVHGVERLRKLPDFVVAPPDVDFVDIQPCRLWRR